jgi:hypothetical protein
MYPGTNSTWNRAYLHKNINNRMTSIEFYSNKLDNIVSSLDSMTLDSPSIKKTISKEKVKQGVRIDKIQEMYGTLSRLRDTDPSILQAYYRYNQADEIDRKEESDELIDKVRDFSCRLEPSIVKFQQKVLKLQYRDAMDRKMNIKFGKEYN